LTPTIDWGRTPIAYDRNTPVEDGSRTPLNLRQHHWLHVGLLHNLRLLVIYSGGYNGFYR